MEIPKRMLNLSPPDKSLGDGSSIIVSMNILPKAEAEGRPVGEGWGEPNIDPKLHTPQEGRGIRAMADGLLVDTSKFSLPGFGFFKKYIILAGLAGTFLMVLVLIMKFL